MSRREFLRTAGRWLAGGLLSGGLGALLGRSHGQCANPGFCAGCPTLRTCDLAPAARARRDVEQERTWQTRK